MIDKQFAKDEDRRVEAVEKESVEAEPVADVGEALQLLHEQLGGFIYCERP